MSTRGRSLKDEGYIHCSTPEQVANDALAGIEQETFVILPHPQVLGYMRKKSENYDRWISGMAKIQAKMREDFGK